MCRKDELVKLCSSLSETNKTATAQLVDEIAFLEGQLAELKQKPFIKYHPTDPTLQKTTPAAKLYKELLQQYNNCIKTLISVCGKAGEEEETSPLREYLKRMRDAE